MSCSKLNLRDRAGCKLVRAANHPFDRLPLRGKFIVEHLRDEKVIGRYIVPNTITTEGKTKLLDVMFHAGSAIGTWYIGLIDNSGVTPPVAGNTYEGIGTTNGWDEFTTYVDQRKQWTEDAAAAGSITNSAPVVFDISGSGEVYGLFLAGGPNAETKGDVTAGNTLWAATAFSGGAVSVGNGDQLKVTYTVNS
jgi:hypothetical protein